MIPKWILSLLVILVCIAPAMAAVDNGGFQTGSLPNWTGYTEVKGGATANISVMAGIGVDASYGCVMNITLIDDDNSEGFASIEQTIPVNFDRIKFSYSIPNINASEMGTWLDVNLIDESGTEYGVYSEGFNATSGWEDVDISVEGTFGFGWESLFPNATANLSFQQVLLNPENNDNAPYNFTLILDDISVESNTTGFNHQDIEMYGAYTLTVNFKDADTLAPIPVVSVIDSVGNNQTTSSATFIQTYAYSAVVLYMSSEGYYSKAVSYIMDEDRTVTVYLTEFIASPTISPQQNTIWSPPQVVFQVLDNNNNPIIGTPVWANAVFTTLPGGMAGALGIFSSTFGLSNTTAAEILNQSTSYYGTTDSSGSVVFMMIPVISYNVTARDTNGSNYTISIMPKDTYYQIKTLNASFQNQALQQIAYETNIRDSIFNTSFHETPDQTQGIMGALIYDSTGQTAGANCWWTLIDNQTTWWDNRTWALGSGLQVINKTVPIVPYQQWNWGCITV